MTAAKRDSLVPVTVTDQALGAWQDAALDPAGEHAPRSAVIEAGLGRRIAGVTA